LYRGRLAYFEQSRSAPQASLAYAQRERRIRHALPSFKKDTAILFLRMFLGVDLFGSRPSGIFRQKPPGGFDAPGAVLIKVLLARRWR